MHEHIHKRIDSIIKDLEHLPSIPNVASNVLTMVNDPEISIKLVAGEISKDQAITANILKLCNSAYFSKGKEISSVDRAIVTLGIKEVKDIVILATTKDILSKPILGYDLSRGDLWKHGVAVAILAKKIAIMKNMKHIADIAFTGGIIHDVGKTVLALFVQSTFKEILELAQKNKIPFTAAEKEIMGYDHQEIGEKILEKWKFPEVLRAIVRYHHEPEKCPQEFMPMVSVIHIANSICLMAGIGIGSDGLYHELSDMAIKLLALKNNELEQLYGDLPQDLQKAQEMF